MRRESPKHYDTTIPLSIWTLETSKNAIIVNFGPYESAVAAAGPSRAQLVMVTADKVP